MQIILKEPLHAGGLEFSALTVNNYFRDAEYAPEGCTVLTCILPGPSYEYWKSAREAGNYLELKQQAI